MNEAYLFCEGLADSGIRTKFDTGAEREVNAGKGRCDLLPLDTITKHILLDDVFLSAIKTYMQDKSLSSLKYALLVFRKEAESLYPDMETLILEAAKQFELGVQKYAPNNWKKGIPVSCYIDSAIRHYLKWNRGDQDEPHANAVVWNLICCIWTIENLPEMLDI